VVLRRVKPDVVVGLGGYITFPAGMMACADGQALVLHEQNSVAGMANRVLAGAGRPGIHCLPRGAGAKGNGWATRCAPSSWPRPTPQARFAGTQRPACACWWSAAAWAPRHSTSVVPQALALIPADQRPGGHPPKRRHPDRRTARQLQRSRRAAGARLTLTPFIDNTAQAFADADLVICRAGASTVTELAAVGAAAVFVPFPSAVDDHQTTNARFLVDQGAAGCCRRRS
jgi:UDP-N-acetylglucosamine--N-acetylmuramyl-(pentapeptide) pyrophosphoryl-undecaprenol N-acetylglucosamine transferase